MSYTGLPEIHEMLEQFEKVDKLSPEDKEAVKRVIKAMIRNQEVKIAVGG